MRHFIRLSRFFAAAAVVALVIAVPLGVLAHEHPDQSDSQCRICKVSGAETAVVHDGPELPTPKDDAGPATEGARLVPASPAGTPGSPRAPPA